MTIAELIRKMIEETKTDIIQYNFTNQISDMYDYYEYKNGKLSIEKFDCIMCDKNVSYNKNDKRYFVVKFWKDESILIFKLLKNDFCKLSNISIDELIK